MTKHAASADTRPIRRLIESVGGCQSDAEPHSTPVVSAILVFFNAERFLEEAIDSVLSQTYNLWELLLVDDGSTDGSQAIAWRYREQHPDRIRYFEHEARQNLGMSASRNLGIAQARGLYITFLDADDVLLSHKLEQQVTTIEEHPEAGWVCGRAQWWYSWTGCRTDMERDFVQRFDVPVNTMIQPPTLLSKFLQDESASLCDILVRRELVHAVGGYEVCFRGMYEDQAFHAKLCLHFPVYVLHACGYRYRQHLASCTALAQHRGEGQYQAARRIFLEWLRAYMFRQVTKHREVFSILRKQLWRSRHPKLYRLLDYRNYSREFENQVIKIGRRTLPTTTRTWLWRQWQAINQGPPVGWVRFGSFRRVTPISYVFGYDRGVPIDRYFVESFLSHNADDIHGRVLEIDDSTYTRRFGNNRVTRCDVLHLSPGNPHATYVGDLVSAEHIPSNIFDCIILTQTLQFIYDVRAALRTVYRILKPGGVVLATFPGISQLADEWHASWCWNFTTVSARRLFADLFPSVGIRIEAYGNVLTAIAFLHGLSVRELRQNELDYRDPNYETLITVRALKPR